jgi:hypothetical protein
MPAIRVPWQVSDNLTHHGNSGRGTAMQFYGQRTYNRKPEANCRNQ